MRYVAVTACPTGIAHTYMAAEKLQTAAARAGHTIKVETQGSIGAENVLTAADIAAADAGVLTPVRRLVDTRCRSELSAAGTARAYELLTAGE